MTSIYIQSLKKRFHFSYINENEITFLCMYDLLDEDSAFAFLSDLRRRFIQSYDYDKIAMFNAYQLTEFCEIIKQLIVNFNLKHRTIIILILNLLKQVK